MNETLVVQKIHCLQWVFQEEETNDSSMNEALVVPIGPSDRRDK